LRYSFSFYFIGIIGHIHRLTIKTIAAISFNTSQLAFLSQGESASKLLNVVPESLTTILYPRISKLETKEEAIEVSCSSFRVTLLILTLGGAVLASISKPLIIFLYGPEFEPTAVVLMIAIPGVIIGSSCLTFKSFFEGSGMANIIPKIQILPVILQVIFAYFFIKSYGLIGAALAFSLGFALYGLVVLFAFIWKNKVPFMKVIPRVKDIMLIQNLTLSIIKKKIS
jgi:O-antigen/teichoic acid export membrane protein